MTRKKTALIFLLIFLFFGFNRGVLAQSETSCDDRYLTLINPVRGRDLWEDKSLKPLEKQYRAIVDYNFSATWLLQYDALTDGELIKFVKNNFSGDQELGIFLEVSPDLAKASRVIYPHSVAWYDPQAVFLSGYSLSEREKLIDTIFKEFKKTFGYYPVSVGTWWLDSYSLEYLKSKYKIRTTLIVANQKTTDDYGVWGQWWGVPYYPSRANILTPAQEKKNQQDVVIIQWAQRDLSSALGEGTSYSNYSLQANDYLERGLDTSYFVQLVDHYLDCRLPIGQVTVGLETGMESVKAFSEYENQLQALSKIKGLHSVAMDGFSSRFREAYEVNPERLVLKDNKSEWILTPQERENLILNEKITYRENLAFIDYFRPDKNEFLDRRLPIDHQQNSCLMFRFLFVLPFILGYLLYCLKKLTKEYWAVSLFIFVSFLTTFLNYSKFGWCVYFGPVLKNMIVAQFALVVVFYFLFIPFLKFFKKKVKDVKLLVLIFSLSFGIDFLISFLRYTNLNGEHYFGFVWNTLRFIGLKFSSESLALVNQDFPSVIIGALLKLDFNIVWGDIILALIIYPLAHIALGSLIYIFINKLPKRFYQFILIILSILLCLYIYKIMTLDPRIVL